jgi:hypothetical protein
MHIIIRSVTNLKILDKKSNSKVKNDRENSEIHIKILLQVLMLNEQENNDYLQLEKLLNAGKQVMDYGSANLTNNNLIHIPLFSFYYYHHTYILFNLH